jgi:hypothetical protein
MRTIAIALLTVFLALAADGPFVGAWAMNKSKSKLDPNGPRYDTLTLQFTQDGSALKSLVTTNGSAGQPMLINGTEQPMSASAGPSLLGATHYVSTVSGRNIETLMKKNGKVVGRRKTTLSADGKVMTAVTDATSPAGQKVHWTIVFDRKQ